MKEKAFRLICSQCGYISKINAKSIRRGSICPDCSHKFLTIYIGTKKELKQFDLIKDIKIVTRKDLTKFLKDAKKIKNDN